MMSEEQLRFYRAGVLYGVAVALGLHSPRITGELLNAFEENPAGHQSEIIDAIFEASRRRYAASPLPDAQEMEQASDDCLHAYDMGVSSGYIDMVNDLTARGL